MCRLALANQDGTKHHLIVERMYLEAYRPATVLLDQRFSAPWSRCQKRSSEYVTFRRAPLGLHVLGVDRSWYESRLLAEHVAIFGSSTTSSA